MHTYIIMYYTVHMYTDMFSYLLMFACLNNGSIYLDPTSTLVFYLIIFVLVPVQPLASLW